MTPPFVRNFYPPSDKRKSEGGLDVIGVKRAISRLGLWPWQEFDDVYNERFATEGVSAFRKSVGLTKTKVYDQATHNKLAAAKVPKGLPHAGELAFDATAVALLQRALDQREPPAMKTGIAMVEFCGRFNDGYCYGGEHDFSLGDDKPSNCFDCSSSTSYVLYHFGLLGVSQAQVSGWFKTWGQPGPGDYVTVYAADDHVWMAFTIPGQRWARFDTSPHGDGARGARVRHRMRDTSRFVSRHPVGL